MTAHPLRLKSLRASVYRAPIDTPVTTSFGIMRDRPMVLVTAEDHDGVEISVAVDVGERDGRIATNVLAG